jgi:hypothetical protein
MSDPYDMCCKLQPDVTEILGGDALVVYNHMTECYYIVDTRLRVAFIYLTRANVIDNVHKSDEPRKMLKRFKGLSDHQFVYGAGME